MIAAYMCRAAVAAGFVGCLSGIAHAQLIAEPLPGDPRLVVFNYDENNSYRIFVKPRAVTNIVLDEDERVRMLALGDTASFQTLRKDNHIFIKPVYPSKVTWGTLLTNKRSYQIQLISTDDGGKWYQRVTFHHPDLAVLAEEAGDKRTLAEMQDQAGGEASPAARPSQAPVVPQLPQGEPVGTAFDPAQLNFSYKVEGKAPFRPEQVFDDGNRTTIRLPQSADTPAVFRINGAEVELLEYTQHPRQPNIVIIPRIVEGMLLKLGRDEVRIFNLQLSRSTRRSYDLGD